MIDVFVLLCLYDDYSLDNNVESTGVLSPLQRAFFLIVCSDFLYSLSKTSDDL